MSGENSIREEQAIGWVIRTRDPGFADWEAFTAWLEEDPDHAWLYDEAMIADADLDGLKPSPTPLKIAPSAPAARPHRRAFLGWAVAASLAAVVGYSMLVPKPSEQFVETAPGTKRTLMLADGSTIRLNGGTRVGFDRDDPRALTLERGEALFTVAHDEARPFTVKAGGATLLDAGTTFNVLLADGDLDVGVAEGAVVYNPDGEKVTLTPGKALHARAGSDQLVVRSVDPAAIGSWRSGRLIYKAAPVAGIASDLGRNLGVAVRADTQVAAEPFSGVIVLDSDKDRSIARAAAVIGVRAERDAKGWVLTTR